MTSLVTAAVKRFYASLPPEGRRPAEDMKGTVTHRCLEGCVYENGSPLHYGVLAIPPDQREVFTTQFSNVVSHNHNVYLDEKRSHPVFPMFAELDFKTGVDALELMWLIKVVRDEVPKDMFESSLSQEYMVEYIDNDLVRSLTSTVYTKLERQELIHNNQPTKDLTWSVLLDVIRDDVAENNIVDHPPLKVMRFLAIYFHVALARVMQRAFREFYPGCSDEDAKALFKVAILINRAPDAFAPEPGKIYNFGAHLYFSGLFVTQPQALYLMEYACTECRKKFPGRAEKMWNTLFDMMPLISRTGGMRLPFSRKASPCKRCKKRKRGEARSTCSECNGVGKTTSNQYYGPAALLVGNGNLPPEAPARRFLRKYKGTLELCTVFTTVTEPVAGFDATGKPAPSNVADPHKQMTVLRGEEYAAQQINKLCKQFGVKEDDPIIGEAVNLMNKLYISDKHLSKSTYIELLLDRDPRLIHLTKIFPQLAADAFKDECWKSPIFNGAVIVHHGNKQSPPNYIVIWPERRSMADGRCYNRRPEHKHRTSFSCETPPGEHSYRNTWFKLHREDPNNMGRPTITQMCSNPNSNPRVYMKCCHQWDGHKVVIKYKDDQHVSFVRNLRNCFFTEQTSAASEDMARKMVKFHGPIYRKSQVPAILMVGPDDRYNYELSAALEETRTQLATQSEQVRRLTGQETTATSTNSTAPTAADSMMIW